MNVNRLFNPCRRHQETLALLAAGLCSPPDKRRVEEHLQTCAACRAQYQELTAVTARIFRLKTETPLVEPGDALRTRWTDQILGGEPSPERVRPVAGEGLFPRRRPGPVELEPSGRWSRRILMRLRTFLPAREPWAFRPLESSENSATAGDSPSPGGEGRGEGGRILSPFTYLLAFPVRHSFGVGGSLKPLALLFAASVLLAFGLGYWHGRSALNDPLANRDVMRETLALFPHRVRAIVEDDRGLNLILSDTPDIPASAPLYIRVTDGHHISSYLTFSGQEITLAGQKVTVLSDPRGGVILAGDHFLWSDTERVSAGRLKIQARTLGPVTM